MVRTSDFVGVVFLVVVVGTSEDGLVVSPNTTVLDIVEASTENTMT